MHMVGPSLFPNLTQYAGRDAVEQGIHFFHNTVTDDNV